MNDMEKGGEESFPDAQARLKIKIGKVTHRHRQTDCDSFYVIGS